MKMLFYSSDLQKKAPDKINPKIHDFSRFKGGDMDVIRKADDVLYIRDDGSALVLKKRLP